MNRMISKPHVRAWPLLVLMAACGGPPEVQSTAAGLSATYVSGHLGTQMECPALSQTSALKDANSIACNPGVGGCQLPRCANGAVLLEVRNIADHDVPIQVQKLEVVDDSSSTTPLAITIVEVATTDGHAVSTIARGQNMTLRILFPEQRSQGTGKIRVTIAGDANNTFEITTPSLQFLPAIAT
jgi:hypothetical protein